MATLEARLKALEAARATAKPRMVALRRPDGPMPTGYEHVLTVPYEYEVPPLLPGESKTEWLRRAPIETLHFILQNNPFSH